MNYKKTASAIVAFCLVLCLFAGFAPRVASAEATYEMSAQYKSSKFYENFKSLELSGDEAHDTVAIALSQLGYHEGNSVKDLDGMNLSGNRDFVEYNVLYGKLDNNQGNGISYGYYWCASFVNWCLRQAGVSVDASAAAEVSCQRWLKKCDQAGIYSVKEGYFPQSADLIFFKDKGSAVAATHMGIVLYSIDGVVYTVEGNTSSDNSFSSDGNYVAVKSYPLDSPYIVGYASPKYEKKAVAEVDRAPYGMSPGSYISSNTIEIFKGDEKIAAVDAYETFSVAEITADGFCVVYEKQGETFTGIVPADVMAKNAIQLTAKSGFRTVKFLDEDGKRLVNTLYLLEESEMKAPLTAPEKEGAGFIYWYYQTDAETSVQPAPINPGETINASEEDVELIAIWDDALYTVTFKDDNGKTLYEIQGYYGDRFEVPQKIDLPAEHYFEGWGVETVPNVITENVTYIAEIRDETPWGKFVESSPLTLGLSLSASFVVLGIVMLVVLYRKKPDEN